MKLVFSLPLKLLSGKKKKKKKPGCSWGLAMELVTRLLNFSWWVPRLVTVITLLAFHAWQG